MHFLFNINIYIYLNIEIINNKVELVEIASQTEAYFLVNGLGMQTEGLEGSCGVLIGPWARSGLHWEESGLFQFQSLLLKGTEPTVARSGGSPIDLVQFEALSRKLERGFVYIYWYHSQIRHIHYIKFGILNSFKKIIDMHKITKCTKHINDKFLL